MKGSHVAALVAVLLAAGCGSQENESGVELYTTYCARCHAADGKGDKRQRRLNPRVDLTTSQMIQRGHRRLIYQRIAYGFGPMPGFRHKLEIKDLEKLADYTLTLKPSD